MEYNEMDKSENLNLKFDSIKNDIEVKDVRFKASTEAALVFLINHFDTLKKYKSYRTRTAFREHIINLLDNEYGKDNYSHDDIYQFMNKKGYFSAYVYFLLSIVIMSLLIFPQYYIFNFDYLTIFNYLFVFVGSFILNYLLDSWGME